MSSPFQQSFSAKSPLHNHGEIKKELKKAKNENEQDYSMERVSDLEEEFTNAKAAHKASKGDPEAKDKDRLDQMSQDANMPGSVAKHKGDIGHKKAFNYGDGYDNEKRKEHNKNQRHNQDGTHDSFDNHLNKKPKKKVKA